MGSLFSGPQIDTSGVSKQLRLGQQASNVKPININAGGLSTNLNGNNLSVTSSGSRNNLVNNISGQYGDYASLLQGLRNQVTDPINGLQAVRLAQNENARKQAIGNLRDNLARRRVLGSSFAQDALTRSNLEFAQNADQIKNASYLQSLDAQQQLANQEYQARVNQFNTKLNELNLQGTLGQNLAQQGNQLAAQIAQLKTQLAAQGANTYGNLAANQARLDAGAQSGAGSLLGYLGDALLGPALGGAGTALNTSLFG